ncbi:MAG: hypothetical protein QM783_13410 [Phycisphaerales bacterium]
MGELFRPSDAHKAVDKAYLKDAGAYKGCHMPLSQWLQDLLDLLCKIYRYWFGKECSDFEGDPSLAIKIVEDNYATEGPPVFTQSGQKAAFLARLDDLETLLGQPGNSLTLEQNLSLQDFIFSLRKQLS